MSTGGRGRDRWRSDQADSDASLSAAVAEALELLAGESAASRAFRSGIVLGALFGAAVAGASLVRHRTTGQGRPGPAR